MQYRYFSRAPGWWDRSLSNIQQDRFDDEKIGVKSLAVLLGSQAWVFLAFLGVLQVGFFAMTALKANMSGIFWVLGLGVWTLNIPWHILSLDSADPKSGGKVFKANIMLGLYMTAIVLVEVFATRVYLHTLPHLVERMRAKAAFWIAMVPWAASGQAGLAVTALLAACTRVREPLLSAAFPWDCRKLSLLWIALVLSASHLRPHLLSWQGRMWRSMHVRRKYAGKIEDLLGPLKVGRR